MDYKYLAIDKLKRYNELKIAENNIRLRIAEIQMNRKSIESPKPSNVPFTTSNTNKTEEKFINLIAQEQEETKTLNRTRNEIKQIENAFQNLTDEEHRTLEAFYICRPKDHIEMLMKEFGYEKSNVYNIKDKALEKFTRSLYGVVHI